MPWNVHSASSDGAEKQPISEPKEDGHSDRHGVGVEHQVAVHVPATVAGPADDVEGAHREAIRPTDHAARSPVD